jgi:hypothetical protein
MMICERPRLEATEIDNRFFSTIQPLSLPVSERIGISMLVQKALSPSLWRDRHIENNPVETYSLNIAWPVLNPAQWNAMTGSIIVARRDRKPLEVAHVDALLVYCEANGYDYETRYKAEVDDMARDYLPIIEDNHQASSQQLLSRASGEVFRDYCWTYMDVVGVGSALEQVSCNGRFLSSMIGS